MKTPLTRLMMNGVRAAVVAIENSVGVRISRRPLEKFYAEFIELVNLDLSRSRGGSCTSAPMSVWNLKLTSRRGSL